MTDGFPDEDSPCGGPRECRLCAALREEDLAERLESTSTGSAEDEAKRKAWREELEAIRAQWGPLL